MKVELGIPDELWDAPNAEIGQMTRECYGIVEDHEEDIEEWYFSDEELDPVEHLCRVKILGNKDTGLYKMCLCDFSVWLYHVRI